MEERISMAKSQKIAAKRELVKIHVRFIMHTPDGLRRVVFDLDKNTSDTGKVSWKIAFQLFERAKKSEHFGDALVDLLVEVDSKLNSKAQSMVDDGMTTSQAAFAIGPAADTAKDPAVSDKRKSTTVQNTLKK
jgi:hypothetical protein